MAAKGCFWSFDSCVLGDLGFLVVATGDTDRLDFFGYKFQFHMIRLEGYEGFLNLLAVYALVILAMNGALVGWAKYNHFRFRGVDRRKGFIAPTVEELAALHQVSSATIAQWQACSVLTVYHDDHGAIVRVVPEPADDAVANLASGRGNGA